MDQPGKVANPSRGQLNRENEYYLLCIYSWLLLKLCLALFFTNDVLMGQVLSVCKPLEVVIDLGLLIYTVSSCIFLLMPVVIEKRRTKN